ncbi:MAG: ribosomal-processing cysteine protease Prp [Lachnospiraceae bacterium]|nr:ribosomal-processing cysteine protease Prp [Lachnospiraceae bacterium]
MITVTIYQDSKQQNCGFEIEGHAGYAESGYDIICASVSALSINCINSIERLTEDEFETECEEETGYLKLMVKSVSVESKLLLDSLALGLVQIEESYGSQFIQIRFEEV